MKISTLGLVLKSGNMVYGFDSVKEEIINADSPIAGILLSRDLSPKSKKEVEFLRDKYRGGLEIIQTEWDMEQIGKAVGKKTGIIAVMDKGFWNSLSKSK